MRPVDPNVFETANAGFAQAIYEEFLRDPTAVDPEWRRLFESGVVGQRDGGADGQRGGGAAGQPQSTQFELKPSNTAPPPLGRTPIFFFF